MKDHREVTIRHEPRGSGGRYIATVEEESITGHLDWEPAGGESDPTRIATHTIVPPAIGGRGVAGFLVERLIADAREHGFKIVPQCWYVAKKFDENQGWSDLRA